MRLREAASQPQHHIGLCYLQAEWAAQAGAGLQVLCEANLSSRLGELHAPAHLHSIQCHDMQSHGLGELASDRGCYSVGHEQLPLHSACHQDFRVRTVVGQTSA